MDELILYSNGCPKCKVLKTKLQRKNISYIEITDVDEMSKLGIDQLPVLSVNGKLLNFISANSYINERGEN